MLEFILNQYFTTTIKTCIMEQQAQNQGLAGQQTSNPQNIPADQLGNQAGGTPDANQPPNRDAAGQDVNVSALPLTPEQQNPQGPGGAEHQMTPQAGTAGTNLGYQGGGQAANPNAEFRGSANFGDGRNIQRETAGKALTPAGFVVTRRHPLTDDLISPSKNSEGWYSLGVYQNVEVFTNGIYDIRTKAALIKFRDIDSAEAFCRSNGIVDGNQLLAGNIIVQESLKPFFAGQKPVIYPMTTPQVNLRGTPALKDVNGKGLPYYRNTVFTDDLTAKDSKLPYQNVTVGGNAQAAVFAQQHLEMSTENPSA
jgi:hypothetical protein